MKKIYTKFLGLVLGLLAVTSAFAQTNVTINSTVGGLSAASSTGGPFGSSRYNMNSMGYSASVINTTGWIQSISFETFDAVASPTTLNGVQVYMRPAAASGALTLIPNVASNYQLVYNGSVTVGNTAGFATTINLQTRYFHTATNGLEVLIIRDHGAALALARTFLGGTLAGTTRNLRYNSTSVPYSPTVSVSAFATRFNAIIGFAGPRTICTGTPPAPSIRTTSTSLTGGCPSTTILQAHGHSTDSLVTFQWEQSTDNGASWANAVGGTGANTPVYTTAAISVNTQFRFKTSCSGNDGISPVWTVNASTTLGTGIARTISTTTSLPLTCQQRITITATGGSTTGVNFQWEVSTNGGTTWNNSDNGWNNTNGATHTTANIHGPTKFRLRSTCTEGGSPVYSNELDVTTSFLPNVTSYPWSENFNSLTGGGQVPCGWTVINAKQTGQAAPIGNTWGARSSTFAAGFNTVGSFTGVSMGYQWTGTAVTANDWLITRPFSFNSTKQYVLSFDAISIDASFLEQIEIWVGSQPTIASLSSGIKIFDNSGIASTRTTYSANGFMVPTTGTYYIGFRIKSDDRWIFQMDDLNIVQNDPCSGVPTATIPTGTFQTCTGYQYSLAATGVSAGATIAYEWQQSTDGGSSWTAAVGTGVNTLNFTSDPLTQNTSFRFRVFCGASSEEFITNSANINLNSFAVSTFPYYDNFDNNSIVSPTLMPCGWTIIDGNNDGTRINRTANAGASASAPNHVSYTFSGVNTANDWAISPALPLLNTKKYTVGLRFATSASAEQFEIRWGNAPTIAAMTNVIYVNNAVGNTSYDTATATSFIPTTSGTYYVGVYVKSPANSSTFRFDNFGIKADDICLGPITGVTASALRTNVCNGASTTFSLSGANASIGLASFRWQVSANGVNYTNTGSSANDTSATYVTPAITTPRWYRCQITCLNTNDVTFTNAVQISIVTPTTPTVTGATRCGTGQVSLFANVPSGIVYWANPSGGPVLSTSNNYGPTISATTTFRTGNVANPFNSNFGPQVLNGTMTGIGNYININGLVFDVTNPNGAIIKTVDFRATQPIGTAYRILIKNSSGTVLATVNGNLTTTFPAVQSSAPINVWLPQGTGYVMEPAAGFNPGFTGYTGGAAYPYTLPGMISITGNNASGIPTGYLYFFNWQVQDGCYSAGANVTGTVTSPIAQVNISATPSSGEVCSGNTAVLNATTVGMTTYTWFPSNVDVVSGANGPVLTVLPTADRTYIVTAHDGNPILAQRCISVDTFQIRFNTSPTGINNSPAVACLGTPVGLTVAGGSLYQERIGFGTEINNQIFGANGQSNIRSQMLFTKAELNAAGFNAGGFITAISFTTSSMNNGGVGYTGFRVGMRNVTAANFNSGTILAGTDTTAFIGTVIPTSNTTFKITFTTPFFWNGNSNLLISTCYSSGFVGATAATRDFVFGVTDPVNVMAHFGTAVGCNATGAATEVPRPNIVFHGGPVSYTWTGSGPALALLSATNVANPSLTASATGNLSYTVIVTDGAGCTKSVPVNITASQPGTWLGGNSSDITNPNNWLCGVLPTPATSITVPSAPNPLVINSDVSYNNFTISSGGSVVLNDPGSITVNGNWTNNGAASMNGGIGAFVDNSAEGVYFSGGSKTISGFTTFRNGRVRNNSTRTVQAGATAGFTGVLTLAPDSNAAWVNNGTTVLRSNSINTGMLNKVLGSSSYTGTLGIERWVSPTTSQVTGEYYMMGSAVAGRTLSNWQAFTPMSGFPGASLGGSSSSVWFYNPNGSPATAGWEAPTDISNPTPVGKGIRIFLRRNGFFANGPGRTSLTGTPQIGTFTFDNTNLSYCPTGCPGVAPGLPNGWNMVANPLPSAIDWSTAHVSGNAEIGKTIYIWRQSQQNYASYNPLTLVSLLSGSSIINSGQGFFIETFGLSPSLTIGEDDKINPETTVPFLRTGTANIPPRIKMRMNWLGVDDVVDEAAVVFYPGATNNFDRMLDARKIGGSIMTLSLLSPANEQLGVNAIETPTAQTVIPMRVYADQTGLFQITLTEVLNIPADMNMFIRDKFLNTTNPVSAGSSYRFVVTSNPASSGDRFELILVPASISSTAPSVKSEPLFEVFPNPSNSSSFNIMAEGLGEGVATVAITDQIGRVVYTTNVELVANDAVQTRLNTNLPRGIYNVAIQSGSRKVIRKMVIE